MRDLGQREGGTTNTPGTLQDQSEGKHNQRERSRQGFPPDAWERKRRCQIAPQFEAPAGNWEHGVQSFLSTPSLATTGRPDLPSALGRQSPPDRNSATFEGFPSRSAAG